MTNLPPCQLMMTLERFKQAVRDDLDEWCGQYRRGYAEREDLYPMLQTERQWIQDFWRWVAERWMVE